MDKEETGLQVVIDRLFDAGRWCGMEINMEKKTKVTRISR
jgi:hypothetical protein